MTYHSLAALAWFLFAPVPRPNSKTGTAGISAGTVAIMIRWRGAAGSFRMASAPAISLTPVSVNRLRHSIIGRMSSRTARTSGSTSVPMSRRRRNSLMNGCPELSTGTPLESHKPTDSMQVTYFDVRPGKEGVSSMRCRLPGVRSLQRPARRHIPGIPGHRRRHVTVHVDGGAYELGQLRRLPQRCRRPVGDRPERLARFRRCGAFQLYRELEAPRGSQQSAVTVFFAAVLPA